MAFNSLVLSFDPDLDPLRSWDGPFFFLKEAAVKKLRFFSSARGGSSGTSKLYFVECKNSVSCWLNILNLLFKKTVLQLAFVGSTEILTSASGSTASAKNTVFAWTFVICFMG